MKIPHPRDAPWYTEQISKLPVTLQVRAIYGYKKAFLDAHEREPVEHKKSNAARFAANTRLRNFVENINKNVYRQ